MMHRDLARELRMRLDNARALAVALNLQTAPRASARQALVLCPWHGERSPSCSIRLAKDGTIQVKCHACGQGADALGLIAQVLGLDDFREVLKVAAEIASASALVDELEAPRQTRERPPAALSDSDYHGIWEFLLERCEPMGRVSPHVAKYLFARGVFADAEAAGVRGLPRDPRELLAAMLAAFERRRLELAGVVRRGADLLDWAEWCLLIPWRDRFGRITCVQRRAIDERNPRYRFPSGRSPRAPFGIDLLRAALEFHGPDAEVIFTEGAIDCLARRRIARQEDTRGAVLGIFSASSPDVGLPLDLLQGRRIVLALDNDRAGEDACQKLFDALKGVAAKFIREKPVSGKDWAEAVLA